MDSPQPTLSYARPLPPQPRYFHIFFLPMLWLPASIGSRIYYGDEYGSFFAAHLPAIPVALVAEGRVSMPALLMIAMIAALLLIIGLAYLLDRVRAPKWIYLLFPVLLGSLFALSIPLSARPWQRESEATTLFRVWAFAVYILTVGTLVLMPVIRGLFRRRIILSDLH